MNYAYFLLAMLVAPYIEAASTGFYDISDLSHPKPLPHQLERVTISSRSNSNKRYDLAFQPSQYFSQPCSQIGLIVEDKTVRFNSCGADGKGWITSIEMTVEDPEIIPQIEQYFHIKARNRKHPGHRMLVEFIPDKSQFKIGEPVNVRLRITNVGDTEFAFMQGGRQRGPRDNQFAFSAEFWGNGTKMLPDTGDPTNFGGKAGPVTVKPGKSHDNRVDLTKWFTFKESGRYNLRGSYYMDFVDPSAHDFFTLWEDFACAEFTVTIKE